MKLSKFDFTILLAITCSQTIQTTPEDLRDCLHTETTDDFVLIDLPSSSQKKNTSEQTSITAVILAKHNQQGEDKNDLGSPSPSQRSESNSSISSILGPELYTETTAPKLAETNKADGLPVAIGLASFNLHSEPNPRHRDSKKINNSDLESQKTGSPLSSFDSLSYQNSGKLQVKANTPSNKDNNTSRGLFDCFKSCWSRKKKKA